MVESCASESLHPSHGASLHPRSSHLLGTNKFAVGFEWHGQERWEGEFAHCRLAPARGKRRDEAADALRSLAEHEPYATYGSPAELRAPPSQLRSFAGGQMICQNISSGCRNASASENPLQAKAAEARTPISPRMVWPKLGSLSSFPDVLPQSRCPLSHSGDIEQSPTTSPRAQITLGKG